MFVSGTFLGRSKLCASNFILESKCLSEVIAKVYSVACA